MNIKNPEKKIRFKFLVVQIKNSVDSLANSMKQEHEE
jgi:hypothetical protein